MYALQAIHVNRTVNRFHVSIPLFFLSLILCLPLAITAAASELSVHGFVSQSYLYSTKNHYLFNSYAGSMEDNNASINFMIDPVDKLRVGLQLTGRDFGKDGNSNVLIDWAYGDYRYKDYLGVRMGKLKNPWGLYNQIIDVDMARTSVYLPQAVYSEAIRDLTLSTEGVNVYGRIGLGFAGKADYDVTVGTLNIPDDELTFFRNAYNSIGNGAFLALQYSGALPAGSSAQYTHYDSPNTESKLFQGNRLTWLTPVKGLKFSGTYTRGELKLGLGANGSVTMPASLGGGTSLARIPTELDVKVKMTYLGFEYTRGWMKVAAEMFERIQDVDTKIMGTSTKQSERPRGYYAFANASFRENMATQLMYSEYYSDWNDRDGKSQAAGYEYLAWQKDIGVAFRYDLNPNWLVKLEGHSMSGAALAYAIEGKPVPEKEWMFFVCRTTVSF